MNDNDNSVREELKDKFDPFYWNGYKVFRHYKYTGINLVAEVNALDPDLVIDVGCGHNRFKGHIKNLIGFDQEPFPFADIVSNIDDINFRPESADVVLALGSVQFESRELVQRHMKKITSWVKPGGFIVMRTMKDWNARRDYPHSESHYIWSKDDIKSIAEENSLEMHTDVFTEEIFNGSNRLQSTRLAWWYKKPGVRKKYTIDPTKCIKYERP